VFWPPRATPTSTPRATARPKPGHVTLPGPHRVASLLKRWNAGTPPLPGSSVSTLQYYLDEFTFRFNRRAGQQLEACSSTGLLQQSVNTDPAPA